MANKSGGENLRAIVNGQFVMPNENDDFVLRNNCAAVFGETITALLPADEFAAVRQSVGEVFDAAGNFVAPGFINVHVHGAMNADTMDATTDALAVMAKFQATTGVTAFLPTTMTMAREKICAALAAVRCAISEEATDGAQILGAHAEGPFISREFCGAQNANNILPPDFSLFAPYSDTIKIITFAPEIFADKKNPPAQTLGDFLRLCRENHIAASIGHTAADTQTVQRALSLGAASFTHLFNGMSGVHHRKGGAALAALTNDATTEIIADNIHVSPTAQKLAWLAKGGKNIALITDSIRACGMNDGESELGGQKVFVKGALATLADGTIAGSVLTMNRAVQNFAAAVGATLPQAVAAATQTPAKLIGAYGERGSLAVGKQADFAVFDGDFNVKATFVGGRTVFCAEEKSGKWQSGS